MILAVIAVSNFLIKFYLFWLKRWLTPLGKLWTFANSKRNTIMAFTLIAPGQKGQPSTTGGWRDLWKSLHCIVPTNLTNMRLRTLRLIERRFYLTLTKYHLIGSNPRHRLQRCCSWSRTSSIPWLVINLKYSLFVIGRLAKGRAGADRSLADGRCSLHADGLVCSMHSGMCRLALHL